MEEKISNGNEFQKMDFEARRNISSKILAAYPDRVPVILLIHPKAKTYKNKKYKFICLRENLVGKFVCELYKYFDPRPSSIYLSVNNTMLKISSTLEEVYEQHHHKDGFLYLYALEENSFGGHNIHLMNI